MYSSDNGVTWSEPTSLKPFLGEIVPSDVGPGVGLRLTKGKWAGNHQYLTYLLTVMAGRLLFIGHHGAYEYDSVWYTDDGGATYNVSQTNFTHMDEVVACAINHYLEKTHSLNHRLSLSSFLMVGSWPTCAIAT